MRAEMLRKIVACILSWAFVGGANTRTRRVQQASDGSPCGSDADCLSSTCGLDSVSPTANQICCFSGDAVLFDFEPFIEEENEDDVVDDDLMSAEPTPTPWFVTYDYITNQKICAGQPVGAVCVYANELCASGVCASDICQAGKLADGENCSDGSDCTSGACGGATADDTTNRICCSSGSAVFNICTGQPAGAGCGRKNSLCASGNCVGGICSGEPLSDSGPGCSADINCASGICVEGECLTRRVPRGGGCDSDGDCLNSKCGLESATINAKGVCCLSNDYAYAGDNYGNVCTELEDGKPCGSSNEVCSGGYCVGGLCSSTEPITITSAPVSTRAPTNVPAAISVIMTDPPAVGPPLTDIPTMTPTITGTTSLKPTMQPTTAPTTMPTHALWGPKTILGLSIELTGATDLTALSIAIFEEEYESHGEATFDGTGPEKFRAVSDYTTKITFVSQSSSTSLGRESGRRLQPGIVVTYNQEISYRADSSIVDLSFVIDAPFKNKKRRNLFRDRLVASGDQAFKSMLEDDAVSTIMLPGTGPDPTSAPTKMPTEPPSSGSRCVIAFFITVICCVSVAALSL